jgi:hypothetical protein
MTFDKAFDDGLDAVVGSLGFLLFFFSEVTAFGSGT